MKFEIQFNYGGENYNARVEQVESGTKTYYDVDYMTEDYSSGGRIHRLEKRSAGDNSANTQWHEYVDTRPLHGREFIQAVGAAISKRPR